MSDRQEMLPQGGEVWPPDGSVELAAFEIAGDPKGAGSKDAIPLGRWGKNAAGQRHFYPHCRESGIPIVNVVDSSGKDGEAWRGEIRQACALVLDAGHELADGPLAVRVTFYGASPKSRYGTGRNAGVLKATADRLPHQSALPDGTKLARALEDALNGLLWSDDRRVCDLWWSRRFGEHPGARVAVWTQPAKFGDQETLFYPDDSSVIIPSYGSDNDTAEDDAFAHVERFQALTG